MLSHQIAGHQIERRPRQCRQDIHAEKARRRHFHQARHQRHHRSDRPHKTAQHDTHQPIAVKKMLGFVHPVRMSGERRKAPDHVMVVIAQQKTHPVPQHCTDESREQHLPHRNAGGAGGSGSGQQQRNARHDDAHQRQGFQKREHGDGQQNPERIAGHPLRQCVEGQIHQGIVRMQSGSGDCNR